MDGADLMRFLCFDRGAIMRLAQQRTSLGHPVQILTRRGPIAAADHM